MADRAAVSIERWGKGLKDEAPIALLAGDALTVRVFEEGDGVFAGKSGELLEGGHVDELAAQRSEAGGERLRERGCV